MPSIGQVAQFGYDPYAAHPDTAGLFSSLKKAVSSAAKVVTKVASAPVNITNAAAKAAGIPIAGKIINMAVLPANYATKLGGTVATSTLNSIANPNIKNIVANAQLALKNAGPLGMVASGAVGAMQAGLSGKNLEQIAWAAAEGAAPTGIDTAIKAAHALRGGANVLTVALSSGAQAFTPASPEAFGFDTAIKALKESATKEALGVARRALPSEGARRAFDVGVGLVAKAGKDAPKLSNLLPRANSLPIVSLVKRANPLSAIPSATQNVLDAVKRNPTLLSSNPQLLAQAMRTNSATVNDALKLAANSRKGGLLPWKSLQPNAVSFIKRFSPSAPLNALRHMHTNIGGLDSAGTAYIVEKGDGPWAIAQKLTGNGNRWKELLDYNKDKKPTIDKNVWVGEVINLPPSWQKPVAVSKPPTTTTPVPVPTSPQIAPAPDPVTQVTQAATSIVPSILQAKAILATWGKTDGINQAGLNDYGQNPIDLSTTMGPRDTLMLQSFQVWDNKTLNTGLNVSGNLDAATLQALQSWVTARATAAIPATSAIPVIASPGQPTQAPSLPSPTPTVEIPAGVIGGTDPTISVKPLPVQTPTATPAVAANKAGSGAPIAIGAVIGGMLFGVPGAIIGGAAGAAVS